MNRIIFFTAGGLNMGVKASDVLNILSADEFYNAFDKQSDIPNVIDVVSLISSGTASSATDSGMIIDMKAGETNLAFLVDNVPGESAAPSVIVPLPPACGRRALKCFPNVALLDEKSMALLIDPEGFREDSAGIEAEKPKEVSVNPLDYSGMATGAENSKAKVLLMPVYQDRNDAGYYFLFSAKQIEEIRGDLNVHHIPLTPAHVDGIAMWHNMIVPVFRLERCFSGAKNLSLASSESFLILKCAVWDGEVFTLQRCAMHGTPGMRTLQLPIECNPVSPETEMKIKKNIVAGCFEWAEGKIIVPDMGNIMLGNV